MRFTGLRSTLPMVWAIGCLPALMATAIANDPVEADWLYLTGEGAWIPRAAELRQASTALPLPIDRLSTDSFWWQADNPDLLVSWQTPERRWWVREDSLVQVEGWSGSWTVLQPGEDMLIMAQAGVRRALPRDQWHRMSWVVGQNISSELELTVLQPEARPNSFRYAWFDPGISAEIRYILDQSAETPRLLQMLVLHNQSNYSLEAPGYSYAQSRDQGRVTLKREAAMMADMAIAAAPVPGDSSGMATLQSQRPIVLSSGSHIWLTAQSIDLSDVSHSYQFNWQTRSRGSQPGQWSLQLSSEDTLPPMAGQVQVAVWDEQVPLLEAHYQPQQNDKATLQLGSSDMVTLSTEPLSDAHWRLTLTNRNSEEVETALALSHWDNNRQLDHALTVQVPAAGERTLTVRLTPMQLIVDEE
ncbi:MAG: hypothetical protein LAT65_04620 [Saccharospirillum sp.]|nr:hypothetical protein [Saccharospirillum sp.]